MSSPAMQDTATVEAIPDVPQQRDPKQAARQALAQTAAQGTNNRADEVKAMMDTLAPDFAAMLGRQMQTDRFKRIVLNLITLNPRLLECTTQSLANAILQAAATGMEPNTQLGLCFIIPRRNTRSNTVEATFQIGYQGLLALARRSGQIVDVHADIVFEADEYDSAHGSQSYLTHKPARIKDRGAMILVYAYARLKNDGFVFVELLPHEIAARKARSKSGDDGPWKTDPFEMAKKTALITLSKYLPKTIEMTFGIEEDYEPDFDHAQLPAGNDYAQLAEGVGHA